MWTRLCFASARNQLIMRDSRFGFSRKLQPLKPKRKFSRRSLDTRRRIADRPTAVGHFSPEAQPKLLN